MPAQQRRPPQPRWHPLLLAAGLATALPAAAAEIVLYPHDDFRGQRVTLGPGAYPTSRSMALENPISSTREPDGPGGGAASPGGR